MFDGLSEGFWETPEPELLHHQEIITLEETQEKLLHPSVVSGGYGGCRWRLMMIFKIMVSYVNVC